MDKNIFKYAVDIKSYVFYIQKNSKNGWELLEEPSDDSVEMKDDNVLKLKNGDTVYRVCFGSIKPCWDLANYIENQAISGLLNIDAIKLGKLQLQYYLKSCSAFDIQLEKDNMGYERIKNFEEMTGPNGLHPDIINLILNRMRS